jgi:hypothetical protein
LSGVLPDPDEVAEGDADEELVVEIVVVWLYEVVTDAALELALLE